MNDDLSFYFSIRSEKLSDMYCFIRQRIGNLPLTSPNLGEREKIREYCLNTNDFELFARILPICSHYLGINPNLSANELALCLEVNESFSHKISLAVAKVV